MDLKAVYESGEEIPETVQFKDLFTEKNGKMELTGISGIKTDADITRLQTSLHKSQEDNKSIKGKLKVWDGWDQTDVQSKLDRMQELEAAGKGKLDDAKIDEIVERRVSGTINSKTAPLKRQIDLLTTENGELKNTNEGWVGKDRNRKVGDNVTKALVKAKVRDEARSNALLQAGMIFEIREDDGAIVTRDGVGVTPGLDADGWLSEIQTIKPHWWPPSMGGGARGTGGGGMSYGGKNPWSADTWNMTDQGRILKEHGTDRAEQMAKQAGTSVGGRKPPRKKAPA